MTISITPVSFSDKVQACFDNFRTHYDPLLMRMQLHHVFETYTTMFSGSQEMARNYVKQRIFALLQEAKDPWQNAQKPQTVPTIDEKLEAFISAMEYAPADLQTSLKGAIATVAQNALSNTSVPASGIIQCFTTLIKPGIAKDEVAQLVRAYLDRKGSNLPAMCNQLRDTPFFSLIGDKHVKAYADHLAAEPKYNAQDLLTLHRIPALWQAFGKASPVPLLMAYAPDVKPINLSPSVMAFNSSSYVLRYSQAAHVVTLQSEGKPFKHDKRWVKSVDDTDCNGVYTLLNHAFGIISGSRKGSLLAEPAWKKKQQENLARPLEDDLEELKDRMLAKRIPVPISLPQVVVPAQF